MIRQIRSSATPTENIAVSTIAVDKSSDTVPPRDQQRQHGYDRDGQLRRGWVGSAAR